MSMYEMKQTLENAMTVKELLDRLAGADQEARVVFACDYGDRGHTEQLLMVSVVVETDSSDVVETAYSHSGLATRSEEDSERDVGEGDIPLVILTHN